MARQLGVNSLAAQGDSKAIKSQMEEWQKDQ